jgi:hypothetical protein
MLTEDEIYKMHYYERIMQRKWKWIISNSFLFYCIGFFISCIINCIENGKLVMNIREMVILLITISIPVFIFVLLWFNQHKKLYKKLKEKENQ